MSADASLADTARRAPYNFSIPRLCFHPTDLFPDRGDPIDFLRDSSATAGQEEQPSESAILTAMDKKLQQSTGVQPQFRVVIGPRLWEFMTAVQYVGFNDFPTKSSSAATSWMSRHVLLTGISGSGKSTLLMTSAAFMTYRTMTNVYRVAGIGDARAWATSGDPLMYFALEMLVALRDYFYSTSEEDEAEAGENADGWIEEAGFLVEPRALTSLADLRAWMLAIRDRLAQEATLDRRRDVRLKLVIIVDQAEYLLEHPNSLPAQVVHLLLELHDAASASMGASFFPSVILGVSCATLDEFAPSPLLAILRRMTPEGQLLTFHLPARLDAAMSERVTRLAIRRSLPFTTSLRRTPFRQWERDLLASGDVRQWTGSVPGETARFFRQSLPSSASGNRILHCLDAYIRSAHEAVYARVQRAIGSCSDGRSEKRRLLAAILRMALHIPLASDDLGVHPALRSLFLPISTRNSDLLGRRSAALPTLQSLYHPRDGLVRLERIPTAVSFAVHMALLHPQLVAFLETKAPSSPDELGVLNRYLDSLLISSFADACGEARRRLISFYARTRFAVGGAPGAVLTGKSQLGDPLAIPLAGSVQPFAGMVASPALCTRHMTAPQIVFVPIRFDYPYYDFFVFDVKERTLYAVTTTKDVWLWCRRGDGGDSRIMEVSVEHMHHPTMSGGATMETSDAGMLTPMALLDAWQDGLQETLAYADTDGAALDAAIRMHDDFFLQGANAGGRSRKKPAVPSASTSALTTGKKRRPAVTAKLLYVEDCRTVAHCFSVTQLSP